MSESPHSRASITKEDIAYSEKSQVREEGVLEVDPKERKRILRKLDL